MTPTRNKTNGYRTLAHAGGALLLAAAASAQPSVPTGFTATSFVSGLSSPTAMDFAPDGRLFVCQQGGSLRVIKNGALLPTAFTTVSVNSSGERGLLGVAFDPNFASNQFVYVYYTTSGLPIHNRVSRFTANGDVAQAGSEVVILNLDNLSSATNHNGGAIHFGSDGKLYVAVGDNANSANAQSMSTRHGKMLRINADGTIPSDNPFFATASGLNRAIWTLGLRNPFAFAVQPGTGRIFINDVGQSSWEEINDGIAGSNYGWPGTEGEFNQASFPNFRRPLFAYPHSGAAPSGCAITGGTFYNPSSPQFPNGYEGDYFYTDHCSGFFRRYDPATDTETVFGTGLSSPVDLKVGPDGALYTLARGGGAVHKVEYPANLVPIVTADPVDQTATVGQAATFTVTAAGAPPLSYQWQRNGTNITGATSSTYTLTNAQLADNGARFRCRVTNSHGNDTSAEAVLTVTSNTAPTGTITQPAAGTLYNAGNTVNYAGTGTDTEDGTLPGSAFTWRVDFHHDTHTHPFVPDTSGATSGTFVIPTTGETASNVWYRIHLTVRDSGGLTHSSFRDVLPRKSTVTLATSPAGLQLTLDGQPVTAPLNFEGVVGVQRTIAAPSPQTVNATTYEFVSWSDGGAATHTIATPASNTTYTATYRVVSSSPTLAVSATTVNPGQQVQVTVQNGPGNRMDWVGLHVSTGGDSAFLDWKYLNGTRTAPATGLTSATLTFAMPQAPGTYNFRLFQNNSYARLATSAIVTVQPGATPTLTLSATTVSAGQTFQVTVGNGPGNAADWLGLHAANGADTALLDWKYLNGSRIAPSIPLTSATIAFQAPSTPGTYNVRFFQNNAYSKLATSATLTVQAAATPTLTLSATSVPRGGQVQVSVATGPGNPGDWLGLHASAAADSSYLDWKYLNGTRTAPATGLTSATVTFTMPQTPGTYNIRFFRNNTYTRLATSAQVTVQ